MAFDDPKFRGGLARTFNRLRLRASDSQLQLGDGCVLSSTNTADRTITFPDNTGTVALLSDVTDGSLIATTTTLGAVIVPTAGNLAVDGSGNITVPLATGSVFGVVKVGTNLSVSGGVVSLDPTDVPLLDAATNAFTGIISMTASRPASVSPTMSAATISLDPSLGNTFLLAGVSSTQATQTANLSASPPAGQFIYVLAKASAAGTVTYTFGTHFKSSGTAAPIASKCIALVFVSDGTDAWEIARSGML